MSVAQPSAEDFGAVSRLYDLAMAENATVHDIIYPAVFGPDEYIGQFSDNSATELKLFGYLMQLPAHSRVLDLGCGRGFIAAYFAREFGWQMTGVDLSAVSVAAGRAVHDTVDLIQGNIYEQTFRTSFDGIYSTGAICHFNAERVFRHCAGLLRKGGRLAIFERVRLGEIEADDWQRLTAGWNCPYVYSIDEYQALLEETGFVVRHSLDTTSSFSHWQERSVEVRDQMREKIVAMTSESYFTTSRELASFENEVTRKGLLGYAAIVAELKS